MNFILWFVIINCDSCHYTTNSEECLDCKDHSKWSCMLGKDYIKEILNKKEVNKICQS